MPRAFRPKPIPDILLCAGAALALASAVAGSARAQVPISSSYSTRDGRIVSYTLACVSTDGSFTAQPCGVNGYPLQVALSGGLALPAGAATAALQPALNADGGALSHVANFPATQAISATALPLPTGAATAALQPALNADGGGQVHVQNFPTSQAVTGTFWPATQQVSAATLPLPTGAATAALQPALNADGGAQIHIQNLPATQVVSNAGTFAVQDAPLIAATATLITNTAARSSAWTDASFTATATPTSPSGLAGVAARTGLHVWNLGAATVCLNYTASASASGSGCTAGSVPIPAGSAYLEDQPGNVSPEAISLVCAAAACPLTIKVR